MLADNNFNYYFSEITKITKIMDRKNLLIRHLHLQVSLQMEQTRAGEVGHLRQIYQRTIDHPEDIPVLIPTQWVGVQARTCLVQASMNCALTIRKQR